ncbi:MAG: aminoacyl--tRNA ligase-related protein, partial [Candidatus Nealsonbacteria bacterium]|nr:aminoacyl--tRNA ligase-related protein [Candidatus Nealsonbacteria bacterium]
MQKIVSLAKRRGFIFPSSEIYGGFGSCYDFGPLGVEMKNNIKKSWWDEMTKQKENIVGLDASILMSPKVWQASGHLTAGFADELVECAKCHKRFRVEEAADKCPECQGELTKPKKFNLMMKTFVGPVESQASQTYLRAETCQGIYVNFLNVMNSMRLKIPFGIAQIGKSFRNEITPSNFIYRTREFEQMEMQWFCAPETADKFFDYFKKERMKWYFDLGINKKNLRAVEVPGAERAHYARRQVDIEYNFPFGWHEIEGIHNRGDYDLSNHSKHSGQDLKTEGVFPYIIET